ncbi:MAG: CPBP family intramembrane metalloprotease [Bacteroidota bacterium]|nr:CPBP family intramembrane metalloprotease [Bacteroidota bacterium]
MKAFAGYLAAWFRNESAGRMILTTLLVTTLIILNYTVGIERRLFLPGPAVLSVPGFYFFYLMVLLAAWAIQLGGPGSDPVVPAEARLPLLLVLLLAPLYFACKMVHWDLSFLAPGGSGGWHYPWNRYIPLVAQWPAKLLLLGVCLAIWRAVWRKGGGESGGEWSFVFTTKGFRAGPYLAILAMLVPLIALASTQHDFLRAYPKLRSIAFMDSLNAMNSTGTLHGHAHPIWPWRLLYELSYGLDFVTIELFFRGWLVVGLSRWLGPKVILPMAAFYCSIHFGKPLGECISSFAGGLALGVLAWRTRSILGGLMVHLGIAWMMEIGGWLGNGWY